MTARKAKEPEAPAYPWSCGFCAPRGGTECHDALGRCRGVWSGFVPVTDENPGGEAVCECAAANHYADEAVVYAIPVVDVELPAEVEGGVSYDSVA